MRQECSFSLWVRLPYTTSTTVVTMDSYFVKSLQKISLTEEEEMDIAVRVNHHRETLEECSLNLFKRFLHEKPLNLRAAKSLLQLVWRMGSDLKIVAVGASLLQFKFLLESQMKWVEDNGPWCFDNHLLVLRRWEKGMYAFNASFHSICVQVQMWGMPFDLMNEEAGKKIGSVLDKVMDVQGRSHVVPWGGRGPCKKKKYIHQSV